MKRSATVLPLQRSGEEKPSWKEEKSPLFKSLRGLSFRRASESVGKTKESNQEFTITHHPDRPARRITEAEIPSEEECRAYLMNVRKASIAEQQLQRSQQEHQYQPFHYQYQQQQQQQQQQQAPIWNHRYLEPEPSWQPQRPTGIPAISKPLPMLPCEEITSALDLELINKRIIRQVNGLEVLEPEEFELPFKSTGEDAAGITRSYSPCPFIGEAKQVRLERLDSVSVSVTASPAVSQASTPRRRSREWVQPQPIQSGRASPKTVVIRRPSRCATTLSPAPRYGAHDARQARESIPSQEPTQSDVKTMQHPQPQQMGQSTSPTKTANHTRFSCSNMAPIARLSPTGSPTCTVQEWMPLLASPPPPPPKRPPPASPRTAFTRRPSRTMDPLNSHPVQVRIRHDSIAEPLCRVCNAGVAEQSGACQRCEDEDSALQIGEDPHKQQYGKQSRPYPQFHKKYPRPLPLLSHSSGSLATVQRLDNSPSLSPETDTASPPFSLRSNSGRMVQTVLTINEPPPPSPLSALSPFEEPRQREDSDNRSNLYKDKWADYYFDEENFDEDRVDRVGNALTTVEMDELVAKI